MPKQKTYDIAIIGAGVVGLAGAIYSGRMNLKTIVFGNERGGTLAKTHVVENYPGFISLSGPELTEKILEHTKAYSNNVDIIMKPVINITGNVGCFKIFTKDEQFTSKTLLFATGSKYRELGVQGEQEFKNKGVHYCALCDGPLYKGKILAVVGGGDSAVKEALLLSEYGKKVYLFARSTIKPEPINLERMKKNKKIEAYEGVEIKEIKGDKFVNEIILTKPIHSSKFSNKLKLDAVFVEIGHIPLSELAVKLGVKVNDEQEIIITREARTNVKGIYAAGDVGDLKFKQAITGVGEAVTAIYSIYDDLKKGEISVSCVDER